MLVITRRSHSSSKVWFILQRLTVTKTVLCVCPNDWMWVVSSAVFLTVTFSPTGDNCIQCQIAAPFSNKHIKMLLKLNTQGEWWSNCLTHETISSWQLLVLPDDSIPLPFNWRCEGGSFTAGSTSVSWKSSGRWASTAICWTPSTAKTSLPLSLSLCLSVCACACACMWHGGVWAGVLSIGCFALGATE